MITHQPDVFSDLSKMTTGVAASRFIRLLSLKPSSTKRFVNLGTEESHKQLWATFDGVPLFARPHRDRALVPSKNILVLQSPDTGFIALKKIREDLGRSLDACCYDEESFSVIKERIELAQVIYRGDPSEENLENLICAQGDAFLMFVDIAIEMEKQGYQFQKW
jgi:hypothetical protein